MAEYGGSASSTVRMRCGYTPLGEQIAEYACGEATVTQKFTGKERDPHSRCRVGVP